MNYCVYKHTSPSGKVYIGITQQRPTKRWGGGKNYDYNTHFMYAILKYGWSNFTHEILFDDLTMTEAKRKEIELIALYDSTNRDKGYNISPGGQIQTPETKAKIQARRQELGLDKIQSERSRARWSDLNFREKTIANMRGKVRSKESRERYRLATIQRGSPSKESVEKMRETLRTKTGEKSIRKRPVLQIAPMTLEVIGRFWTTREAAVAVGASINGVAGVCRRCGNKIKAGYGYFWCYEDEYNPADFEQYRGVPFTEKGKFPRMGERASGTGRVLSEDVKNKIGAAHARPILCIETGERFDSIRSAANKYRVDQTAINNCLRGKSKTSCGYHWCYVTDGLTNV